ncbi:MAG: cobyrinate a,c-diamide synthase [Lachnospiraceae bacterium]|nr:cobyrinate a,c-diamide synthase [Lachnospiraceae bacterium]
MVTLIGLGGGSAGGMTAEALEALSGAEIWIGARRVLDALPEGAALRIAEYLPEEILRIVRENENKSICLLFSGDTGFYSGASKLIAHFNREGIDYKVLPGISSVQLLSAKIGLPWQDWRLVSAHGKACDPVEEIRRGGDVFFLTGGKVTPGSLCRELNEGGYGSLTAVVGEALTYPSERIRRGKVEAFAGKDFDGLSVVLVLGTKAGSLAGRDAKAAGTGSDPEAFEPAASAASSRKKRIMISAMGSGSGKTVLTCGLLSALKERGIACEAMKCGPDYIDPMFHAKVLGLPGRNLDPFLQGACGVEHVLRGQKASLALIEGAMGFYDGVAGTTEASAWELAAAHGIPVVLAVRPGGSSVTLAAQIRGILEFRRPSGVAGLILTACREGLYRHLKPIIERETGLALLGYLPPMKEAEIKSRHLGLMTAGELADFKERFEKIAAQMEKTVDLDRLMELAGSFEAEPEAEMSSQRKCRIAVARDEGFSFYYEDSFEALREAGAEIIFFSPIHDRALPDCGGLYLGGGYPELYAAELEANVPMRESIREAVKGGLPTVAECGGFLYLQQSLEDTAGEKHAMAGVLPGEGVRTDRLQRFGYAYLLPEEDSLLFRKGERIPVHEFHYWDSTEYGSDLRAVKPDGRSWPCGFTSPTLYAGFPHLDLGGEAGLAARFAAAAAAAKEGRK